MSFRHLPGWAEAGSATVDATVLAVACLITYLVAVHTLTTFTFVSRDSDLLGGMWAVIATIFVIRNSYRQSLSAAATRMSATMVSFVVCLVYLAFLPFEPWGLALLIGASTLIVTLLGRPEDAITAAITTTVVMVVAAVSPQDAWQQPILRFADTVVGVAVGIGAAWISLRVLHPLIDGGRVADVMVTHLTTHGSDATSTSVASFFRDEQVRMALIVTEDGRLITAIERSDLPPSTGAVVPAVTMGTLVGRTVGPTDSLRTARAILRRRGGSRLAVVGEGGALVGLLCLDEVGRGSSSDRNRRRRQEERSVQRPPDDATAPTRRPVTDGSTDRIECLARIVYVGGPSAVPRPTRPGSSRRIPSVCGT